mgnify:FL=1
MRRRFTERSVPVKGNIPVGALVRIASYPSRFEKVGDTGLVVRDCTGPNQENQCVIVSFNNGSVANKAHFTLEVISEKG